MVPVAKIATQRGTGGREAPDNGIRCLDAGNDWVWLFPDGRRPFRRAPMMATYQQGESPVSANATMP